MHEEQDIFKMGGLKDKMPITRWTFLVSTLAIAGIFPFSGFFSKDEILWKALTSVNPYWGTNLSSVLYWLGIAGAFCTAFYMFRLYTLTFSGESRVDPELLPHVHESPQSMTIPLIVLALGGAANGVLGLPEVMGHNLFHHWLEPVVGRGHAIAAQHGVAMMGVNEHLAHNHAWEWGLMAFSLALAVGTSLFAYRYYFAGTGRAEKAAAKLGILYKASFHKYAIDEIYRGIFIEPFKQAAKLLFQWVDRALIDILGVTGTSWIVDIFGRLLRRFQSGAVQHYLVVLLIGIVAVLYFAAVQ